MPFAAACAPTEIWQLIVGFAASKNAVECVVDYAPFQPAEEVHETAATWREERIRLQTCAALSLVSRRCRALVVEYLYRDVRVVDAAGLTSLVRALRRSANEDGDSALGLLVRRLELPHRRVWPRRAMSEQSLPFHPFPIDPSIPTLADILALCPRLEVLVRACIRLDGAGMHLWAHLASAPILAPLLCLRRLEWHETELEPRFYGNSNDALLRDLVGCSPNLRYLFVSSDRPSAFAELSLPPTLDTLRLNRSNFHTSENRRLETRQTRRSAPRLPYTVTLRRLVLHTPLSSSVLDFVETVGMQVRTLELAFAPQMAFSAGQLRRILTRIPVVEELVFALGAPELAPLGEGVHAPNIKCLHLKVNSEEWNPCKPLVRTQIEVLEGASFPGLREVVLYDFGAGWFQKREIGRHVRHQYLPSPVMASSSSRSAEQTYEAQNDQRLDELHSKLRTLRGITTDIYDDVESQNLILDETGNRFNSFGASLTQTARRAGQAFGFGEGGLRTWRVAIYVVGFFFAFLIMRRIWSWWGAPVAPEV
ncbi:t-SNARE coiled-coil-like proteiny domain-containing protein [Mycena chlorophos]|uniref:t-SNARE coiled-coil-like proteiny domain-containing protein n=1 Tax=Mycena chlorophos TaxID=658473 RepID=A0A8H6S756_MYCCL|nr:t-SNARE coiled-coil-like proteiny domain-containing protein [Mycena chlorophos]